MAGNISDKEKLRRWLELEQLQEAFPDTIEGFLLFAQTIINTMITGNPNLNRVQADICKWLHSGDLYRMIQAQRGQAKTTLTAIYAAFRLIHAPHTRVVIFSQSGKRAKEISSWIVKIFNRIDFLEFMRPDESAGDRASVEAFDIHWVLKGSDKSPSVACQSIEAGAQGMRADVLIADDVESLQNSRTVNGRELLEDVTKEFESINQYGDIIYLGTPQSGESIYNNLPSRGYTIRIWPGRYPTVDEVGNYGGMLAPMLLADIEKDPSLQTGYGRAGVSGAPTCPEMFSDEILCKKELSQGTSKFQLQYMLNTQIADANRFPLKLSNLIVASYSYEEAPMMPVWANGRRNVVESLPNFGNRPTDKFFYAIDRDYDWVKYERSVMYIDPAGGGKNGDETGYAIIKLIGTYIYLMEVGGVEGGYEEEKLMKLVQAAKRCNVQTVYIEKNFGHGAHVSMLKPLFQKHFPAVVEEVYEHGQKEQRIIDVLEPIITSHRLVVSPDVIDQDYSSTAIYPLSKRSRYSCFHQMAFITMDKGCLVHDDRLDALAGAVRQIVETIDYDMEFEVNRRKAKEESEWLAIMNDPLKRREHLTGTSAGRAARKGRFM